MARLVQTLLADATHVSFHVHHVISESAALESLSSNAYDVMLFDLSVPEIATIEDIMAMRQGAPRIPVLLLSDEEREELALAAVAEGCEGYVFKEDLRGRELVRAIRCAVERYRMHRELEQQIESNRRSQAQFHTIVGNSADGIIIFDGWGVVRFVNPSAERMFGRTMADLVGEVIGVPVVRGGAVEIDVICRKGVAGVAEMRVVEIVWEGRTAFLATLRDITTRKHTERALQKSEQRYKQLLGSVTDYIYTLHVSQGRVVSTTHSASCVSVTGYTSAEYVTDPYLWYKMVYEDDRAMVTAHASQVVAGKVVAPIEHRIIHKSGTIRWIRNTPVPRYDAAGTMVACDGLITDITAQRLAQEEVRTLNAELEQRVVERTDQLAAANEVLETEILERRRVEVELRKLSRAVEQSPVSIVITDTRGNIEYVNPRFSQTTGYTFEEVLGQNPRVLKSGELPPARYAELWQTITAGQEWRRRKDGTLFWESASISPIVNEQGEITHFLGIKENITEYKRMVEDLQRAREDAEAATRAKSDFLASMSHEIRTPLNAIIGMTTLLRHSELIPEQADYVETIHICGDALLNIINDVLDFSKIEAGKVDLEQRPFDVRECVEGALDVVAAQAASKGLDLAFLIADETPLIVVGDVNRLRQIVVNLLSNAVKFTERGEVVVSVGGQWVGAGEQSYTLRLSVRDTGIGIPAERLGRLFQSFSQVDNSISRRFGGTGLGLSISKSLAEMMGGQLWVESVEGEGSTFHVSVLVTAATEQPWVWWRSIHPDLEGKRVLLVDDNATMGTLLAQSVGTWGMLPFITTDASEALACLHQGQSFDVVLLDMTMPGVDGPQLVADIRALVGGTPVSLVLLEPFGVGRLSLQEWMVGEQIAVLSTPVKPARLYEVLVSLFSGEVEHVQIQETLGGWGEVGSLRGEGAELAQIAHHYPLRILVAEDNTFNQKVILLLLARLGYHARVVAHGGEVLAALEQEAYDVVLMDVQMSGMNGIETTRALRDRGGNGDVSIYPWIIAMTAHVLEGDREQCLAAGMNDYIAKPVRLEELIAALKRAAQQVGPGPSHEAVGGGRRPNGEGQHRGASREDLSPAATPAPPPIDHTVLDRFLAEMGDETTDMREEIMQLFLESVTPLLDEIAQGVAAQDRTVLYRAAHTLKSSSAQMGAMALAALCQELERCGKSGPFATCETLATRVHEEFSLVRATLEELLAKS
jgi:PAS domain S-box-containing protein